MLTPDSHIVRNPAEALGSGLVGDLPANSHKITGLQDPASAQDAATKNYVDAAAAGARDLKNHVRIATSRAGLPAYTRTGNVLQANANGALPSQDGVTPNVNDRMLVWDSGIAHADHGLYVVTALGDGSHPWILTRAADANSSAQVGAGTFVWATEGTVNADVGFLLITPDPITLNTTTLTFAIALRSGKLPLSTSAGQILIADGAGGWKVLAPGSNHEMLVSSGAADEVWNFIQGVNFHPAISNTFRPIFFGGHNGAGACTATGARLGDKVIFMIGGAGGTLTGGTPAGSFESTIAVQDQIQQSDAGDLHSNFYFALLLAQS